MTVFSLSHSCNPGYIISSTGVCESCECSTAGSENHICDPVSGECVCRDGYEGSRCDRCQSTHIYTGDECLACPCPRTEGRNFADQCSYIEASVSCSCSEGFTGLQCEECDAGYFAEFAGMLVTTVYTVIHVQWMPDVRTLLGVAI